MAVFNDIFAIVTAGQSAVFRIAITGLLDDLGVEYSCCEDVYAATDRLRDVFVLPVLSVPKR